MKTDMLNDKVIADGPCRQAMVLAAGLGTRLRPWTLHHPKALVPVGGVPMLDRVMSRLRTQGFGHIIVNVHHFAGQIKAHLSSEDNDDVHISDESGCLLDTGGGLLHARQYMDADCQILVHNVDILSNADLRQLYDGAWGFDGLTLLVSNRESSRRLVFDSAMMLKGWMNCVTGETRPSGFEVVSDMHPFAFSGIYVAGQKSLDEMEAIFGRTRPFSIIDYMLHPDRRVAVRGVVADRLELIDIGKPETLSRAESLIGGDMLV